MSWILRCILILTVSAVGLTQTTNKVEDATTKTPYLHEPPFEFEFPATNNPLRLNKGETIQIPFILKLNRRVMDIKSNRTLVYVHIKSKTITPHFDILQLETPDSFSVTLPTSNPDYIKFNQTISFTATYIGHAQLLPTIEVSRNNINQTYSRAPLKITVIKKEGLIENLFTSTVIILMILTYINMGSQLDLANVKKLFRNPFPMIVGFVISVLLMPIVSWFLVSYFLPNKEIDMIGAFVLASTPPASSAAIYTAMCDSDKELAFGLHIISFLGSIISMPTILYFLEQAMTANHVQHKEFQVPYTRLLISLSSLIVALAIGHLLIRKGSRIHDLATKIYKPFMMIVVLTIIVLSSSIYWYIYLLFTWDVLTTVMAVSVCTYFGAFIMGYLVLGCDVERAVAISICSTYKNSGISLAVLVVAFEAPDSIIAYVPSLAQTLATAIIMYLFLSFKFIKTKCQRRGQPDIIQTEAPMSSNEIEKEHRSSDASYKSSCDEKQLDDTKFGVET